LGRCLADNTTGKDRKDLARWIFLGIASHPEIRSLSNATAADLEASSRKTGELFTRLIAEACAKEISAAVQADGPLSLQQAFGVLGQVAIQELVNHPDVQAASSMFARFIDEKRINAVIERK
jgi:hypothetical protein